jgi:hypothetical protein
MNKIEIEFIKDQIKQTLTLKDIVEFYIGQPNQYTGRYKCPFNHDENHCNLEVKEKYWRCFSCNLSGDEIELVRQLFGLTDYKDCLRKIAEDFGLKQTTEFDPEYEKRIKKIKAERDKAKKDKEILEQKSREIYNKLIKRQFELEEVIRKNEPYNPKRLQNYMKTKCPDILMHAVKQYNQNEVIVNIFLGYDISDYDSVIYGCAITNEEKNALKNKIVRDIIDNKIIINEKGDIVKAYGYKL